MIKVIFDTLKTLSCTYILLPVLYEIIIEYKLAIGVYFYFKRILL